MSNDNYNLKSALVDYRIALLAKQLGYNKPSVWYYEDNDIVSSYHRNWNFDEDKVLKTITIPTKSELQEWLRKEYDIQVAITRSVRNDTYGVNINKDFVRIFEFGQFGDYNEALILALRETLEYIIEHGLKPGIN